MTRLKLLFLTCGLFTLGFLVFPHTTLAQQVTLTLNPPKVESIMKPGKSILIGYTFQNLGDPTAVSVKVRTFSPKGDYGEMNIDPDQRSPIHFSLDNADFEYDKPFFMRQADVKQALVRIQVPENTPEGDYYFVFLVETEAVPSVGGVSNPLAKASIGSTLLLTVSSTGLTEVKSRIGLFDMVPDFTFTFGGQKYNVIESGTQIPVHLILQNLGNNLIKPQGAITLRGPLGEKSDYPLLPQNILNQSSRLIKATGGAPGKPELSLLIPGYFIGPYTLSTSISFGDNTPQLYANTSFIAIPVRFIYVLFGVVLVSLIIINLMRKRRE